MEAKELQSIVEALSRIESIVESLKKRTADIVQPNKSSDLKDLFGALAKAQAEMSVASESRENPYFKNRYADLAELVRVSRIPLTKHGISIIQQIMPNDEGQTILHTMLCHNSGQWIESRLKIVPPKNDIQTFGSYITYLRRYSYAAICGIVSGQDDDDGEIAMIEARDMIAKGPSTKYNPKEQSFETVTKEQLDELEYELEQYPDLAEMLLEKMNIRNLADLPKSQYSVCIRRLREIKQLRNGVQQPK